MESSKKYPLESDTVQKIYEWHERQEKGDPHHGRLGASVIGRPCDRFLWYSFRNLFRKAFPGRILRLFKTGHLEEPRFIEELRGIGCTVHDVDSDTGKQFEFTALGGHFVCHPDGALLGLPEAPKTWHIAEFKTMGGTEDQKSKDFEKVSKDGVKRAKPEHYAQMQVGMGLSGMTRALYLAKKKATDELYGERIRYDSDKFNSLMDRAKRVICATSPLERCTDRPDDFRCRFCDAFSLCWATGDMAVQVPERTCRSCCHATPEIDEDREWARWSCAKYDEDIKLSASARKCIDHLLLPGLISFADPTDSGDDWIEFTNREDGAVWRHGNKEGMWTTEELMRAPGPIIGEKTVQVVKEAFDGTVVAFDDGKELTLIERYPPEDCELVWEGKPDEEAFFMIKQELGLRTDAELQAVLIDDLDNDTHYAAEYGGRLLYVDYKDHNYAAVWKGKT